MSLFDMLYAYLKWLQGMAYAIVGYQEAQEGPSNDEEVSEDESLFSLCVVRLQGEPIVCMPEGVPVLEALAFIDECYEHGHIFGFVDPSNLTIVDVNIDLVEEIRLVQKPIESKRRVKTEPGPSVIPFRRKE